MLQQSATLEAVPWSREGLATGLTSGLYSAAFLACWFGFGVVLSPVAMLPVLLAASFYGLRGGLLAAGAFAALHFGALGLDGANIGMLIESVGGSALLLGVGAGVGVMRDRITAQLQQRRESEERYVIAARGASDGLFDWNLKTDEVYYSEPFAALLGYSEQEIGDSPDEWFARVHPDDLPFVREGISKHLAGLSERYEQEHRMRRKDGSWVWMLGRGIATLESDGTPRRMTGWLTDIAERKQSEAQLRHHAFHDALTGVPNRALFMERLSHALVRARRGPTHRFAIIVLDLDRFKLINDSLGHVAGDELLVAVAERLQSCLRPADTVARMGGDEFMLLLEDVNEAQDAVTVAERIHQALSSPLPLSGHDVVTVASMGIALGDSTTTQAQDLLRDADTAMYEAKRRRNGRPVLFDAAMHERAVERLAIENALRSALERREMFVQYQPIISLTTGRVVGFEALARWRHPTLGLISPLHFIPLAEETGLIGEIGLWILLEASSQARAWQRIGEHTSTLRMSVNLSVRQMQQDPELLSRIDQALETSGLAASSLSLEITESVIVEDTDKGAHLLEQLRRRGIRVCMDDFGTGYSSLSYLHRFRVDSLKIDMAFVRDLDKPESRSEIVRTILSLSRSLGLTAVAEGVETEPQLQRLRDLGCDEAQGYLFAPPLDAAAAEALLRSERRW